MRTSSVTSRLRPAALARLGRDGPVVLCYHGVGAPPRVDDPEFLCVHPDRLRTHIGLLRQAGFSFVTASELAARVAGGASTRRLAVLTFDDGYEDNHSTLLPLLREFDVPATVFVATGLIGGPNPWMRPGSGLRMLTEAEIRTLAGAGIEIGAHTVTHPNLSGLDLDACRIEVGDSKATLEALVGTPVTAFAYPYFFHGPAAVEAVRQAGFRIALSGRRLGGLDLLTHDRILITGKDGVPGFLLRLSGAYEPLFASRAGRVVRATTRGLRTRVRQRREG